MLAIRDYIKPVPALPKGMAGREIMARYADGKAIKDEWVPHLEECYRYAIPGRNTFYPTSPGAKKTANIFDSTAILAVPGFATKMQSILIPPWREFSMLSLGPEAIRQKLESTEIKRRLAEQNDILFSHINHSNYGSQAHESLQDLAISTGAYTCQSGYLGGKALNFNAIPLSELVLEEGPDSTIQTTYRCMKVKARNILQTWPGANIPNDLQQIINASPNTRVSFIEAVIFDPNMQRWEGAVVWENKQQVIWKTSFNTNPRIVFRWSPTPGELYGRGPVMQVLPDIKTANKVVEFILRNAALAVSPVYTALSDMAINPYNFRIVPGGVIPVDSNSTTNPTIRALERSGDIRVGFEVLEQLHIVIKRALFQHLRNPSDPVRSATEIAIDNRDLVDQAGSSMGRQQTELIEQTVIRAIDVLQQRGEMADIKVDGRLVTLKHTSPLAKAQDTDDMLALERTLSSVPQESLPMGIKVEDIAAWVADKTGLDPRLIRTEGERAAIQDKAQEVLQQHQGQVAA